MQLFGLAIFVDSILIVDFGQDAVASVGRKFVVLKRIAPQTKNKIRAY